MARGEHINVRRRGGIYTHHGIDMGDGTVIHFSGEPFRGADARICRIAMAEFLQGGRATLVRHRGRERGPDDVARAALSLLAERRYSLLFGNCEHFATWCATGRWRSRQVKRAVRLAAGVAGAVAVLTYVAVERRLRAPHIVAG